MNDHKELIPESLLEEVNTFIDRYQSKRDKKELTLWVENLVRRHTNVKELLEKDPENKTLQRNEVTLLIASWQN